MSYSFNYYCHQVALLDLIDECKPYSCSAYEDWLEATGTPPSAPAWSTTSESYLEYPFSTYAGEPGKFTLYRDFSAAPTPQYAWSPDGGTPTSSWITQSNTSAGQITNSPDFCSGTINQVACLNTGVSSGPDAITPANVPGNAWWGDHYSEFILARHNLVGGFNLATLIRNSGKTWQWRRISSSRLAADPAPISVSGVIDANNDVVLTITVASSTNGATVDGGTQTQTLNVGPLPQNELIRISTSFESVTPYVKPDPARPTTHSAMARMVTLTLWCRGQSISITKEQAYTGWDGTLNYNSIAPWYGANMYAKPYMFASTSTQVVCSIASMTHGVIADGTGSEMYAKATIAWERNYQDYAVPPYCPVYVTP